MKALDKMRNIFWLEGKSFSINARIGEAKSKTTDVFDIQISGKYLLAFYLKLSTFGWRRTMIFVFLLSVMLSDFCNLYGFDAIR